MPGLLIDAEVREVIRRQKELAAQTVEVLTPNLVRRMHDFSSTEYRVHMELMAKLTTRAMKNFSVTFSHEMHCLPNGVAPIAMMHISISLTSGQGEPSDHAVRMIAKEYGFVFDHSDPRTTPRHNHIYREETADGTIAINIIQSLIMEEE